MYIDAEVIAKAAALVGALGAIGGLCYKIITWVQTQNKQSADIEELNAKMERENRTIKSELCLLNYAILAALKGLKEQGCDGPVTEAIAKLEKHLNQSAHGQEETSD